MLVAAAVQILSCLLDASVNAGGSSIKCQPVGHCKPRDGSGLFCL